MGSLKSYIDFKTDLGNQENSGIYNTANSSGYLGKYQFGMARLRELGYSGTAQNFLSNPSLQETYFDLHVQNHSKNLYPLINLIRAKGGTLSGAVAAAHLGGITGARNFINRNIDPKDRNGTHLSYYFSKFSGYDIPNYNEDQSSGNQIAKQGTENAEQATGSPVNFSAAGFKPAPLLILLGAGILSYVLFY